MKASVGGDWYADLQQALRQLPKLRHMQIHTIEDIWSQEHLSSHHELIHIRQGRAKLLYSGRAVEVGPDDTMLVPQNLPHSDRRTSPGEYQALMILFEWSSGDTLLQNLDVRRLAHLPGQAKLHLRLLVHELEREYLADRPDVLARASAVLAELLIACVRYCQDESPKIPQASRRAAVRRRQQLTESVRAYLQEHYAEAIGLEELAETFRASTFHLSRAFSQDFGMSMTDMLAGIRMEHAREMLISGTLSVKEIASDVGYTSGNYFSKAFRRYYGLSPSEYQLKKTSVKR